MHFESNLNLTTRLFDRVTDNFRFSEAILIIRETRLTETFVKIVRCLSRRKLAGQCYL